VALGFGALSTARGVREAGWMLVALAVLAGALLAATARSAQPTASSAQPTAGSALRTAGSARPNAGCALPTAGSAQPGGEVADEQVPAVAC
jgi:hypothetical protein